MDYTRLKSVEEQSKKNAKDIEELSKAIHDLKQSSDNRLAFMKNQFASIFAVLSNKTAASQAEQPQVSIEQIGACKLIDKIPQSILGEVREEMTTGRAVFGQNGLKNEAHKMFEVMSKPVPTEKETSLSIEEPQALRNVDPILAVAAYNSVEVVFEVRHLPDYEGETTAKQILGVQSDFENGADKVLDGTTISVATGLQLFHPNHITEREYSSHSFSRNEVSSFLYNSLSFNPGNLFIDGGPQPPTLMIGSVEVTHRLFDKFPQLITVEPNQEMYADRYYIPPLLDCVLQIFDPGSSSLIVCCDFLDTSGVKHDFDKMPGNSNVELWFGKILSFVFDPGGSYLCYNGKERQDSAYSELQVLDLSSEFVCIHDSARPLMIAEDVEKVMKNGFIHVWQDKMFASVNYIADCFSIGSVLDLNEVPSKVAKVFAKPSTILLKAMLEVPFAFKRRETLFYIFLPICKRTLFGIWKLEVGFVNNSVNDLRTWKFGENKCKLVLLSSRKRKSVLAMVTTLEHFVWDPGQCAIFVYILEDKDVFKRVGNRIVRMDITWVIMEVSKDVQNNCIIMRWCEMARYLRLSCDNANDGYMLQTEHMVKG